MTPPPHEPRPARAVLTLLVAADLFLLFTFREVGFDLFYHMKAGELMFARGEILRADPFSHTMQGHPWITHEWGFEVLAALAYRAIGIEGMIVAKSLLLVGAFLLLGRACRREGLAPGPTSLLLLATGYLVGFRAMVRPHVFTLVALTCLTGILRRVRSAGEVTGKGGGGRSLLLLPPLFWIWANVHSGFVIGLGVALVLLTGWAIEGRLRSRPVHLGRAWLALAASGLACLANPNLFDAFAYPFVLLLHPAWTRGIHEYFSPFDPAFRGAVFVPIFLAVAALAAITFPARRRSLPLADAALLAVVLALSLRGVRNVSIFGIVAAPILAANLGRGTGRILERLRGLASQRAATVGCAVLLAANAAWLATRPVPIGPRTASRFGIGFAEEHIPSGAARFLEREGIGGNLFNSYGFGSYLDWRLWPFTRVFLDGRTVLFRPVSGDYRTILHRGPGFEERIRAYRIDVFFLEYPDYASLPPGGGMIHEYLRDSPRWALVYWDDSALVYARTDAPPRGGKGGGAGARVRRLALEHFDPAARSDPVRGDPRRAVEELEGVFRRNPHNARAARYLGDLLYRARRYPEALAWYERTLKLRPESPFVLLRLGHTHLALDHLDTAARLLRRGLRSAPRRGPERQAALRALERIRRARPGG